MESMQGSPIAAVRANSNGKDEGTGFSLEDWISRYTTFNCIDN
jgi:hypothetical protein